MKRVSVFLLFCACAAVLMYDAQLVIARLTMSGAQPINWLKIVWGVIIQCSAVVLTVWYARFLRHNARSETPFVASMSLRLRLLPLIVPVVLSMLSVTLLEIGLLCGDQPIPSIRGRSVCPNEPSSR